MERTIVALALALLFSACTPTSAAMPTPSPATPLAKGQEFGRPGCHPASPTDLWQAGWPELRGTTKGGELWALLDGFPLPAPRSVDLKFIWRMTGNGEFSVRAIGPSNQTLKPDWGPQAHGGSNWNQPGDEWGTGFTFPAGGCWDLRAMRGHLTGDVYIEVA